MAGYRYNRTKTCFRLSRVVRRDLTPPETYNTKECCNPMLVLAHTTDNTSWKNDITSAWVKLPDIITDSVDFKLYKKGDVLATYQPSKTTFLNDDAFYCTIDWRDVLASDGIGCYYLYVTTIIDGETNSYVWGEYDLRTYSADNAKNTIRIKTLLNQYYSIEDIDFTGTKLIDCIRIGGFFGDMSPDFVIDNLIYENRRFENIQRERIAKYTLKTNPILFKYSDLLLNVHLLSENTIWISDHNPFNHSLLYKDKELIVESSPEVEYKEFSNLASISVTFTDKVRNNLAKYNG